VLKSWEKLCWSAVLGRFNCYRFFPTKHLIIYFICKVWNIYNTLLKNISLATWVDFASYRFPFWLNNFFYHKTTVLKHSPYLSDMALMKFLCSWNSESFKCLSESLEGFHSSVMLVLKDYSKIFPTMFLVETLECMYKVRKQHLTSLKVSNNIFCTEQDSLFNYWSSYYSGLEIKEVCIIFFKTETGDMNCRWGQNVYIE
jgi:hypothetical protein